MDRTLPNAPNTAAAGEKGWTTVEGKAARKRKPKKRNSKEGLEDNDRNQTDPGNTGNARRSPRNNRPAKKAWADVVRAGGINVQILLGNGNLGQTTTKTKKGERRG
ncbi:hypothetical protein FPQ18DRAFT_307936 [Pyronema domesticum]|nr:hypothetical protein FPQ18DRAFT_307936 [Pyronema domesticum]